jgi:rubrerythrin
MLTREQLLKAIEGEKDAVAFYQHAKTLTGDEEHIKTLDGIIADEEKHLGHFEELMRRKFSSSSRERLEPHIPAGAGGGGTLPHPMHKFTDALRRAIGDELDTAEFYRDIYMDCTNEQIKALFFESMTDEMEHAARLNMMYTREVEKSAM